MSIEDYQIDFVTGEMTLRVSSLPLRPVYRLPYFRLPKNPTIEQLQKEQAFLDQQWTCHQLGEPSIYSIKVKRAGR
jgi:hypothetical protein